jgi:glycerophosphoryl diester phosphodiesterase
MNKLTEIKRFQPPWIIAHRGYQAKYPENTLSAFKAALEAGAAMIELDVTFSRDRRLVVIHDADLERTTNGRGPVNGLILDELKQLDAGGWLHPRFSGERLPELAEVLDLAKGRAFIDIEIKSSAYEPDHPPDSIERQVVELVRQKEIQDYVLISSFEEKILTQLSSMEAAPPLALIAKHSADDHTVERCSRLNLFSWHPEQLVVTPDQVKMMHTAGMRVFPYNVNTAAELERMLAMGVDGMITDDPLLTGVRLAHRKAA